MERFGITPEKLLEGTGLDSVRMNSKNALISGLDYLRIVSRALDLTCDPALGLKVGKSLNLFEYGVWGYAIMSCATAGEAMSAALRYWELNGALVNVAMKRKEGNIVWTISPSLGQEEMRLVRFSVEEFLSTLFAACRFLFGREMTLLDLSLSYPEPDYGSLYRELAGCPVHFDQEENSITIEPSMADWQTVTGHLDMRAACETLCEELMRKLTRSDALIETIRHRLIQSMGRFPKAEDMARQLAMSPRTLYRRLSEKGISYQTILDEVREDLAKSYLEHTRLSIDQVSDLIGFTETTTFRRTFKKWTGVSPSEYRKK
jgi:AraC-like DNA-binding protein